VHRRLFVHDDRKRNGKGRTLPKAGFDPDPAAVHLNDSLSIARPSPVPPFFRVIEVSDCWNSSNILFWSAVEMPGPVLRKAIVNDPLAAEARTATSSASVNLIALPTRLSNTCVTRRWSPWARGRPGGNSVFQGEVLLGRERLHSAQRRLHYFADRIVHQRKGELAGLDF
jgi:hypothetical protein